MLKYLFRIEVKYTIRDKDSYEHSVKEIQKEYAED